MADAIRVRQYEGKANVRFDRRKDGWVRKIMVYTHGDDYRRRAKQGYDRDFTHNVETKTNPPRVWEFDRECGERAGEPHS